MKYLLALFGEEPDQQGEMSPEAMAAMMEPWSKFGEELVNSGAYIAGEGLQPSATASSIHNQVGGEQIVSDGPFAETKEQLGGFYLIDCASIDEAQQWAKKVPMGEGSTIEVRPVMDFTGYESPAGGESS
jgi:hypothetical protein